MRFKVSILYSLLLIDAAIGLRWFREEPSDSRESIRSHLRRQLQGQEAPVPLVPQQENSTGKKSPEPRNGPKRKPGQKAGADSTGNKKRPTNQQLQGPIQPLSGKPVPVVQPQTLAAADVVKEGTAAQKPALTNITNNTATGPEPTVANTTRTTTPSAPVVTEVGAKAANETVAPVVDGSETVANGTNPEAPMGLEPLAAGNSTNTTSPPRSNEDLPGVEPNATKPLLSNSSSTSNGNASTAAETVLRGNITESRIVEGGNTTESSIDPSSHLANATANNSTVTSQEETIPENGGHGVMLDGKNETFQDDKNGTEAIVPTDNVNNITANATEPATAPAASNATQVVANENTIAEGSKNVTNATVAGEGVHITGDDNGGTPIPPGKPRPTEEEKNPDNQEQQENKNPGTPEENIQEQQEEGSEKASGESSPPPEENNQEPEGTGSDGQDNGEGGPDEKPADDDHATEQNVFEEPGDKDKETKEPEQVTEKPEAKEPEQVPEEPEIVKPSNQDNTKCDPMKQCHGHGKCRPNSVECDCDLPWAGGTCSYNLCIGIENCGECVDAATVSGEPLGCYWRDGDCYGDKQFASEGETCPAISFLSIWTILQLIGFLSIATGVGYFFWKRRRQSGQSIPYQPIPVSSDVPVGESWNWEGDEEDHVQLLHPMKPEDKRPEPYSDRISTQGFKKQPSTAGGKANALGIRKASDPSVPPNLPPPPPPPIGHTKKSGSASGASVNDIDVFAELGMEAHPTFRSNMSRRGEGAGTAGRLSSAKDAIDNDMKSTDWLNDDDIDDLIK